LPTDSAKLDPIEKRMSDLRSLITQMGDEADSGRAKTAAALGGGAFALLLALGGIYDLATGNVSVQIALGVSRDLFTIIVIALTVSSLVLLAVALVRERGRSRAREEELDALEEELAQLLDRKNALSRQID